MKDITIKELLHGTRDTMNIERSLANTHVHGLHSLVLIDGPRMVRMYYATKDHELWCNSITRMDNGDPRLDEILSIAIHPHQQNIKLIPVFGSVVNHSFVLLSDDDHYTPHQVELEAFQYTSAIISKRGEFTQCGLRQLSHVRSIKLRSSLSMHAKELHTVYVPRGQCAAWVIIEGPADAEYDSTCYSNADLTQFEWEGLCQPMNRELADSILDDCIARLGDQ